MSVINNGIEFISTIFTQFWTFAENNPVIAIPLYVVAVGAVIGLMMWLIHGLAGLGGGNTSSPASKKKGESK